MTLQRRLLLWLLLCAPLVWALALVVSAQRARKEVNELFDTEMIRLARQVQATLPGVPASGTPVSPAPGGGSAGEADLRDLAIAVWDADGSLRLVDREGAQLPRRADAAGFVDLALGGEAWRVYYLQSPRGDSLVAAGQRVYERDELVWDLVSGQLLPWLAVLPVLLVVMAWAVRRSLAPLHALAGELRRRRADELQPLAAADIPRELEPLRAAMNGLFGRIDELLARERRFTADAAHELRTPLAALRAQWDVVRGAGGDERRAAEARLSAGFERVERLVSQMLALSRVDATERLPRAEAIDWPGVVEQAIGDCLPLAAQRGIELACEWPPHGQVPWPLRGDPDLIGVLLRNLVDNAVRYAPAGTTVSVHVATDGLRVENDGPPLAPEVLAHLGERFRRAGGQEASGAGLGISIVQRIAALHGLALRHGAGAGGRGVVAALAPSAPAGLTAA